MQSQEIKLIRLVEFPETESAGLRRYRDSHYPHLKRELQVAARAWTGPRDGSFVREKGRWLDVGCMWITERSNSKMVTG